MKDSNQTEIVIGNQVLVPEPNQSDLHVHEFEGYVKSFRDENVVVEDMDGDCYEIEPERLTVKD